MTAPVRSTAAADRAGDWLSAPVECGPAAGLGVYVHVPSSVRELPGGGTRYVAAIRSDLDRLTAPARGGASGPDGHAPPARRTVRSVLVGGAPWCLPRPELVTLLGDLGARLESRAAQTTVEYLPGRMSPGLAAALADAGVTRVSLAAGRARPGGADGDPAGPDLLREVVGCARGAGIPHVDVSVAYGTGGRGWRRHIETVAASGADHVTVSEAGGADGERGGAGSILRDRFDQAIAVLTAAGLDHYELTAFARTDASRSAPMLLYARHGDYLAVGAGAHGHRDGRRWWTFPTPGGYVRALDAGRSPVAGQEVLDRPQRALERLLLGLRLRAGLDLRDVPPVDQQALRETVAAGLVETVDGRLRATPRGWFLLDAAVRRLS